MNAKTLFAIAVAAALTIAILAVNDWLLWAVGLHARSWIAGSLPLLAFWGIADGLIVRLKPDGHELPPLERAVYAGMLALCMAAVLAFVLLTLGIGVDIVFITLAGVFILIDRWGWIARDKAVITSLKRVDTRSLPLQFCGLFVVLLALAASTPPLWYDTLEYHLPAPETYLANGGWVAFPYNVYAAFPQNVELIYIWPLAAGSATGAKVSLFWMALLSAAGVAALLKRWGYDAVAWWGAAAFLGTGLAMRVVLHGKIDMALCLTAIVLFIAYDRYRRSVNPLDGLLIAAAIGFSLGAKYVAVIALAVPFFLTADSFWKREAWRPLAGALIWSAAGFALLCAPWLVRNTLLYENPVYPLLTTQLGGEPPIFAQLFSAAHAAPLDEYSTAPMKFIADLFSIPFDKSIRESMPIGFSPLWILALPVLLFARRESGLNRAMAFCIVACLAWFVLTQRNDRFLAPLLPLLAVLPAWAIGVSRGAARNALIVAASLILVVQAWSASRILLSPSSADFLLSPTLEETYIAERMPHFRAIEWLNAQAAETPESVGTVLFVGEAQAYGAGFETIAPTVFNRHPLEQSIPANVSHILYNRSELIRLTNGYGPLGWPLGPILQSRIESLEAAGAIQPVYRDEEFSDVVIVYELVEAS